MRKIAILNFKGGTAKTTTAVNLSHALALRRQSVLVVDCDPQGSVADCLGVNIGNTFFDLLTDRVRLQDCIYSARKRLDIIPSDRKLTLIEVRLAKERDMEKAFQKELRSLKDYDFVFLDCPPSMSILNLNALEYAKEIFILVSMDYLSLRGVQQIAESLPEGIEVTKIIPTFYDQRTRKSKEILDDLKSFFKSRLQVLLESM
ncbi:unnamed protein product [marine sediment metagenome]|uniref:AAA domain-containing protein n=1 Tax=marine sediment metagenome TaxID=412755 RepID=X1R5Y6_9ZZZZ